MRPALALLLGTALGGVHDVPAPGLESMIADYTRTTEELRASSAKLRANCHGPRWQRLPYGGWQ